MFDWPAQKKTSPINTSPAVLVSPAGRGGEGVRTTRRHRGKDGAPAAVQPGARLHTGAAERHRHRGTGRGLAVNVDRPVALQHRMILKHGMEELRASRRRLRRLEARRLRRRLLLRARQKRTSDEQNSECCRRNPRGPAEFHEPLLGNVD